MNATFQFLRKNTENQQMSTPQKKSVPLEYVTPDDVRVDDSEPTDGASILSTFEGDVYYKPWYEELYFRYQGIFPKKRPR